MRTNKELLKDVLIESSKGALTGGGAGMLINSGTPMLEDIGDNANYLDRFKFYRGMKGEFPKEALPLVLGGGMAAYNAGEEVGNELFDRLDAKIRAKKKKRD